MIDIFCTKQVIVIATFSCRVTCAVIACLCLAGTAVDLFIVQGSWKFWVTAEEPRQAEESDFRISSNQTEPLLINNGLSESTGLPSVQYMQPSLEERGSAVTGLFNSTQMLKFKSQLKCFRICQF